MIFGALFAGAIVTLGFICETQESAKAVAIDRLWADPGQMPSDCRLIGEKGLPYIAAYVLELVDTFGVDDGRFIAVGRVRRNHTETGYSAGEVKLLIVRNDL